MKQCKTKQLMNVTSGPGEVSGTGSNLKQPSPNPELGHVAGYDQRTVEEIDATPLPAHVATNLMETDTGDLYGGEDVNVLTEADEVDHGGLRDYL